jgi:cytochrome c oxidase subunit II
VLTHRCALFAALGGLIMLTAGCGGSGGSTPTAGNSARGKALYTSLTCDGCHTLTGIRATGPTFRGLAGSQVKLKSGKTVTADDDYLFESIETPNKEIVASFSALMEAVIKPHSVSEEDARDLIAFIKTVR